MRNILSIIGAILGVDLCSHEFGVYSEKIECIHCGKRLPTQFLDEEHYADYLRSK